LINPLIIEIDLFKMLASISYRYLKEKYEVISGSGAQAQNGNDARWNSEEIFAPLCAVFNYKIAGLQACLLRVCS
jgi:hypothetical protein